MMVEEVDEEGGGGGGGGGTLSMVNQEEESKAKETRDEISFKTKLRPIIQRISGSGGEIGWGSERQSEST